MITHYLTAVAIFLCVRCVSYSFDKIHNEEVIQLFVKAVQKTYRCCYQTYRVILYVGGKNPYGGYRIQ